MQRVLACFYFIFIKFVEVISRNFVFKIVGYSKIYFKISWVVIVFILCSQSQAQTFIFVRRTSAEIFVASDSYERTRHFDRLGNQTFSKIDTTCKIRRCGDFFIAVAGESKVPEFGYDIFEIASRLAKTERNIVRLTERIDIAIRAPIHKIAKIMRTIDADHFLNVFVNGMGNLGFCIFGEFQDTLYACTRQIKEPNSEKNSKSLLRFFRRRA